MNFDVIKSKLKLNPKTGVMILALNSLKDRDKCKKIMESITSPYNVIIQKSGIKEIEKWIYYINLGKDYQYNGFCSIIKQVLQLLAYADYFDFLPVIKIGNSSMYYEQDIGENVFEYYFMPVSEINYRDINNYKKVILSKPYDVTLFGEMGGYKIPSDNEISLLGNLFKKYIQLNERTKETFWSYLSEYTFEKTLGVHVRATDFNKGYNNHPVVIKPTEYLEKVKEVYREYGYKKVFLASDDATVIELFKQTFGENVFFYEDTYRSTDGSAIHYNNEQVNRNLHKYLLGIEIIRDYYTLGYCDGLIAGNSNVSICARIVKYSTGKQFKNLVIIDKGINHNLKRVRSNFRNMLKSKG